MGFCRYERTKNVLEEKKIREVNYSSYLGTKKQYMQASL